MKRKVVEAYQKGEGRYRYLIEKYGIINKRQVLNWVHSYNEFGEDGLKRLNKNYYFQFKLSVVKLYLSSEVSYQELMLLQGIHNSS
ncbi:MAG: helix-turn-helix domain containing protein, partial [Ruminococcus sp.]|nr:helix-turn-helix domain containing protein [Ruminococcus sp.]